jgi:hypothetical protein
MPGCQKYGSIFNRVFELLAMVCGVSRHGKCSYRNHPVLAQFRSRVFGYEQCVTFLYP